MPIPDDEKFEEYLRQFKPLAADPLPAGRRRPLWQFWLYAVPAAAALAILLVFFITERYRTGLRVSPLAENPGSSAGGGDLVTSEPLTLHAANDLLAHAPSFNAALDNVAFHRQRSKLPQGSLSALAALSKEDIKL